MGILSVLFSLYVQNKAEYTREGCSSAAVATFICRDPQTPVPVLCVVLKRSCAFPEIPAWEPTAPNSNLQFLRWLFLPSVGLNDIAVFAARRSRTSTLAKLCAETGMFGTSYLKPLTVGTLVLQQRDRGTGGTSGRVCRNFSPTSAELFVAAFL